jgi:hypothetical protein
LFVLRISEHVNALGGGPRQSLGGCLGILCRGRRDQPNREKNCQKIFHVISPLDDCVPLRPLLPLTRS